MFEPIDFHRAEEVRNFFKFHISQFLFFLHQLAFFFFHKPWHQGGSGCIFRSEVFKSTDTHELDYQFPIGFNQIVQQIDEFQHNGSGWAVDHIQHLYLQSFIKYMRLTVVFMRNSALQEKFNFCLSRAFC